MAACCMFAAYVIYRVINIHSSISGSIMRFGQTKPTAHTELDLKVHAVKSSLALAGLSCAACAGAIRRACESVAGVREVWVQVAGANGSSARILHDSTTSPGRIASAVRAAGYGATVLSSDAPWKQTWAKCGADQNQSLPRSLVFSYIVSLFATVLVAALDLPCQWLSLEGSTCRSLATVRSCVALTCGLVAAWPIHKEALGSCRQRVVTPSSLTSLGLAISMTLSFGMFEPLETHHFAGLVSQCLLISVLLGGRLAKAAVTRRNTLFSAQAMASLPDTVRLMSFAEFEADRGTPLALDGVEPDDLILVPAQTTFPVDGTILRGSTLVVETLLTGELSSKPRSAGATVLAGTRNISEDVIVRVVRTREHTWLGQMLHLVLEAGFRKNSLELLADRFLERFSQCVLVLSIVVSLHKYMATRASWADALMQTATILLAACPCSVGLGIPACGAFAIANASNAGVLLTGGPAQLEVLTKIRAVFFDKTGTLTLGRSKMRRSSLSTDWRSCPSDQALFWTIVATVEQHSCHPVALGLQEEAKEQLDRQVEQQRPCVHVLDGSVEQHLGYGIKASIVHNDQSFTVAIGNLRLLQVTESGLDVNKASQSHLDMEVDSLSSVYVFINDRVAARIWYSDELNPSSRGLIQELMSRSITVGIITGDTANSANAVAQELGIDPSRVYAGFNPLEKAHLLEKLQIELGPSVMVGDHVNDMAAVAKAAFGISLCTDATGHLPVTDSDAVLLPRQSGQSDVTDLRRILYVLDLAQASVSRAKLILYGSAIYNVFWLSLCSGFLESFVSSSITPSPFLASTGMAISSIFTLLGSLRILGWRPAEKKS